MEDVAGIFAAMKFRRRAFGGVDEMDVWKKLENLQREYRSAYEKQEERFQALLKERDEEIRALREGKLAGGQKETASGEANALPREDVPHE